MSLIYLGEWGRLLKHGVEDREPREVGVLSSTSLHLEGAGWQGRPRRQTARVGVVWALGKGHQSQRWGRRRSGSEASLWGVRSVPGGAGLGPGEWALSKWVVPALCPLGTSPVAIAEVWEAPDIAQAHGIAHARQYKLDLVAPVAPFEVLLPLGGLAGHSTILWGQEKVTISEAFASMPGPLLLPQWGHQGPSELPPPTLGFVSAGRSHSRPGRSQSREERLPGGAKWGFPPEPPSTHSRAPSHLRSCCQ